MARPVQIDRQRALKAARGVFWRRGYNATSMSHLLDAMGMGAGSFYAAFDNKSRLFARVLDDYTDWSMDRFDAIREDVTGLSAVRSFLIETLIDVSDAERRKGCLLVNSVLELDSVEPELYRRAASGLGRVNERLLQCVEEARAEDSLRPDLTDEQIVRLLMTLIQGLRVESRLGMTRDAAEQRLDSMLKLVSQ